eukprot:6199171-Pleurochrysis_carterae.AAC.4
MHEPELISSGRSMALFQACCMSTVLQSTSRSKRVACSDHMITLHLAYCFNALLDIFHDICNLDTPALLRTHY